MKKASWVLKIICVSVVILCGLLWIGVNIASYVDYVAALDKITDVGFFDYLKDFYNGFIFFAAILTVVCGIYCLFHLLSFVNIKRSADSTLSLVTQYKSLLDSGVITQEEFDAKKKEILKL